MTHVAEDNFAFGCFMDCLTACEFMCDSEDGKESMATKIKNANGAGPASLLEVHVLTSIHNGLPALFTSGKATSSFCPLPRLDKFTKWEDDQQYESGMKSEMTDFMGTKLEEIIAPKIEDLKAPKARELATLMLQKTTQFWVLFIEQLSKTYTDLNTRLKLSTVKAWNFATSEAGRVLREVNNPRLSAMDVGAEALKHRAHVCASVLYAMLKCHAVMQEFVTAQFKNHPSIASEQIKLLFNNMATTGDGSQMEEINRLKAMLGRQPYLPVAGPRPPVVWSRSVLCRGGGGKGGATRTTERTKAHHSSRRIDASRATSRSLRGSDGKRQGKTRPLASVASLRRKLDRAWHVRMKKCADKRTRTHTSLHRHSTSCL